MHTTTTPVLFLLVLSTLAHSQESRTEVDWLRDVDHARTIAAETDREVFVLFTGRGWCQPCEMLDQLLFHDAEFVARLQELCVPVELDFNFGDSNSEKVREARFRNWAKRYLVLGYPTMVFMDSDGQPFFVAQYPVGKPADFMARIEKAISRKKLRDKLFAYAESSEGSLRAQQLHAGILAVAQQLTTIKERHDDPVLTYYADEVVAIMTTRFASLPMPGESRTMGPAGGGCKLQVTCWRCDLRKETRCTLTNHAGSSQPRPVER